MSIRSLLPYCGLALLLTVLCQPIDAQPVRLRSKITPDCGVQSNLKFADIYADGNIAVMGTYSCRGVFIFNVADPDHPALSNWYDPLPHRQFLEAIVIGNRGYFGSGNGGGVHIVDLTDPTSPQLLGVVDDAHGNAFNSIHEMIVFQQGGATYLIENFNGFANKLLKVINVSNPSVPVFVRDISPTEVNWVHAMHVRGDRLFTSGWGSSGGTPARGRTEIYDITDLGGQTPALLGYIEDPNPSATNGNNMHSSWTSEDGNYLYSAREVTDSNGASPGDVRVYDISDPSTPLLVDRLSMSDLRLNAVTPHNPVVMGNKLYVSWYQAGLQVFDVSQPSKLKRIGQYDTYELAFLPKKTPSKVQDLSWDLLCGVKNVQNSLPTSYGGAWAVYPFLGEDRVLIGDLEAGLLIVDVTGTASPPKNPVADFDGDRGTDLSFFRPSNGNWYKYNNSNGGSDVVHWGGQGDVVLPGDYDGDGTSEYAIWRPSEGNWWIAKSTGNYDVIRFGLQGDIPVPADYDADGKTDIAVWRPSDGVWYIWQSTLGPKFVKWGISGDKPLAGDYDGDGKADLGIWRPGDGVWYVVQSSNSIPLYIKWGVAGDRPVKGDFIGDGRDDFAVYRPGEGIWYILNAELTGYLFSRFGLAEDIPVQADYDKDGKADISVFRPSTGVWYRINSSDNSIFAKQFGSNGDLPTPAFVNPD